MFYKDEYDANSSSSASAALPGSSVDSVHEQSAEDAVIAQKMERMKMAAQRRPGTASMRRPPASPSHGALFSPSPSPSAHSQSFSQQSSSSSAGRSLAEEFAAEQARSLPPATRASLASPTSSSQPNDDDVDRDEEDDDAVGPAPAVAAFASTPTRSASMSRGAFSAESTLDFSSRPRELVLSQPPAKGARILCYVRRIRSGLKKFHPEYHLYMNGDVFLMSAKKRGGKKTASYLVSTSQDDLSRTGEAYFGKLRSNFVGTEFHLYDSGENPKTKGIPDERVRKDLGLVLYEPNILGNKGPRRMTVVVPAAGVEVRPREEKDGIGARFKSASLDGLVCLRNKEPVWNEQLKAYVLNFNGRVSMASVKNFQLIDADRPQEVVMQFGKVDENVFTLDFAHPLSALQAFLIALSSFDHKLACE